MSCTRGCCPSPREHYLSLSYVDYGQGTGHAADRQLSKDRDAYKRLRQNGVQPRSVDGSAQIEQRATTVEQVEGRPDAHGQ